MTVLCHRGCGREINPHDVSTWKEVTGYVGGPKKDSMVLRTDTGNYACTPCVHKAKEGQAPDQADLFEQVETPSEKWLREKQESDDAFDRGWAEAEGGIGDE